MLVGLLLSAALAAARWLTSDSLAGLLGHLLPDGEHARALLCLSADVLCRVCSCRHRATAAGKEHPRAFNLYQISIFPYTVCTPRPPALVCILMHALFRFCTCSQPTNPCAPRRDVCNGCRWRRRWTSNCSRSTTPRCTRSHRVIVTWIVRVAVVLGAGGAAEGSLCGSRNMLLRYVRFGVNIGVNKVVASSKHAPV